MFYKTSSSKVATSSSKHEMDGSKVATNGSKHETDSSKVVASSSKHETDSCKVVANGSKYKTDSCKVATNSSKHQTRERKHRLSHRAWASTFAISKRQTHKAKNCKRACPFPTRQQKTARQKIKCPALAQPLLLDGTGTNWWTISEIQTFDATAFYQPVSVTDPFGGITQLTYDSHKLLIETVTDADNRTTEVENNYRLLQAWKMTDPNGNSQCVDFDTLGMVKAMAVMGKNGEGDTLTSPTIIYEYDLHNWKNNAKPVYSHVKTRETHADPDTRWMESYTYTSGLGQEVQTKVQAEDGLAWILPASGIPEQIETTDRWVATGRTILNNKGKAVKQYEPWFSTTPDYEPETELTEYGVTPILHYDPLTRNIKTDFPDGTFTKVEFTPWEQKSYDQNDNVLASQWYALRSPSSTASTEDKRAAQITIPHDNTPQTQYFDSMGRVFIVEDDNGTIGKYRVHNTLDIGGRPTLVIDAKGREMTRHFYAYKQPLYTRNIDSGKRWMVGDVAGKPIRAWNERGHSFRNTYDILQRPLEMFVAENNTEKMVQRQEYGSDATKNNIGQVVSVCSQDGKNYFNLFDFKNNLLTLVKRFAEDYQNVLDWSGNVILQSEEFTTQTTYDALNRPITITQPDATVASYVYNKGGLLEQVLHGATEYISNINYNEKGQRSDVYYGNNTKTKSYYDAKTFRLKRLLTTRNNGVDIMQDLNYTFDAVGNIVQQNDNAQQIHYYNNQVIAPNCTYTYDPLYRLINATGRELTSLAMPTNEDFANNIGVPNQAVNAMQIYNHTYVFDELGNMQSDNWKDYVYDTTTNRLLKHDPNQTLNDYTYDVHGNMLTMPHLTSMVWDYADRLQSAGNGTFTSYYNYDLGGHRSRKVVVKNNNREERYYIGDYEIYRKYINDELDTERNTVHIIDDRDRFAMIETETGNTPVVRYQYNNHLGSACLELDTTAAIISYEEYHPYGTTSYRSGRTETEVSLKRYKYVGKERDEETGLYYYGARYYAAWLCRFVSVDQLQFKYPHYTPYQYAGNKPISYIDLDGLEEASPSTSNYTIKKGDTFWGIENNLKLKHGTLSELNPNIDPTKLQINQNIFIEGPKSRIIFVNGKIGGGSPPAGKEYWNDGQLTNDSDFVKGAKEYYKTNDVFYTSTDYEPLSTSKERFELGYNFAKHFFGYLTYGMDKSRDEFSFVSHSMGAAYAEGIAHYLIEKGFKVKDIIHINAFQAADIETVDSNSNLVRTIDYQNTDDPVINNPFRSSPGKIKGADYSIRERSGVYEGTSDRFTFIDMISDKNNARAIHASPIYKGRDFWRNLNKLIIKNSPFDKLKPLNII